MKHLTLFAALALAACATTGPVREIETQEVVVTRTERAVTEAQARETAPPAPMGARPSALTAALDVAVAKLCEYVSYAEKADLLVQHAAGLTPVRRVHEPVCEEQPPPG